MFYRVAILSLILLSLSGSSVNAQAERGKGVAKKGIGAAGNLRTLSPTERQTLLAVRESAWRAFFAGDTATLKKILPAEFIAMNEGGSDWQGLASVFEESKQFAAAGGKLMRLEFPKTEIQAYGATAIIYTTYLYEIEMNGKREVSQGRGTEMFVFRDKQWLHNGWHLDAVK